MLTQEQYNEMTDQYTAMEARATAAEGLLFPILEAVVDAWLASRPPVLPERKREIESVIQSTLHRQQSGESAFTEWIEGLHASGCDPVAEGLNSSFTFLAGWEAAQQRITALEAALARAEGNLTTACILIGNLLSSDDEADVAAGRAFIDGMVAGRERTPAMAGAAGEEDDRDA